MEETLNIEHRPEKTVENTIKQESIVWVISSNLNVECGKVFEILDDNKAYVFIYDSWSLCIVEYKNIIRVGTSYFSDTYRNMTQSNIR